LAYIRGNGSVEVELARTQSWIETTDPVLFGDERDCGMVKEHQVEMAEKKATHKLVRRVLAFISLMCSIPAILKTLEVLHIIPK
jgi:hypothetical protein